MLFVEVAFKQASFPHCELNASCDRAVTEVLGPKATVVHARRIRQ